MFVLAVLSDSVRVPPADLRRPRTEAVADALHRKYANCVVPNVGLCICLYDLGAIGDALVVPGDGCMHMRGAARPAAALAVAP
jgi:DNA-directed RNA polymerase III subunit RPC8